MWDLFDKLSLLSGGKSSTSVLLVLPVSVVCCFVRLASRVA